MKIESHDDCVYDHLEIRDGGNKNANVLAMLCGYNLPAPIKSTSNQIYIKFFSDDSVMKRGFSLNFIAGKSWHGSNKRKEDNHVKIHQACL